LIQGAAYEVENLLGLIWLLEDCERFGNTSPVAGRGIGPAANEDYRQHVAATPHSFEKLDTAHSRHVHIEDQAVALTGSAGIKKRLARCELPRLQALAFEQQPQRVPSSSIIVNHKKSSVFSCPHPGPIFARLHPSALIWIG
jgi:hypothetical protein